jgi:periplasmic protein TonB
MSVPRSQWRRLVPCVALIVVAHTALLALPMRPAVAASRPAAALQVRIIAVAPEMVAEANQRVALRSAQSVRHAAVEPAPPPAPLTALAQQPVAPTAPTEPDMAPWPVQAGLALPRVGTEDDHYLARSLLTVPPVSLTPVLINYPDAPDTGDRYRGELTLFIDETGAVVRVRAEGDALPPALEDAARRAFMSTRFSPGELAEHGAVKSRIRVEVVFERDAAPSAKG